MNNVNTKINYFYKSHIEIHSDIKNFSHENDTNYNFYDGIKSKLRNNSMIKYTINGLEIFGSTCYINLILQCLTNWIHPSYFFIKRQIKFIMS